MVLHFTYFVQLYPKRVSCAVPLRIVTMKAAGELTPSQPAVIDIIPDQVPLIQGRRQQTPHPLPNRRNSYDRQQTPHPLPVRRNSYEETYESSKTEEFPNANNHAGYYYDKDYYKYYKSYYYDNGDVGFQFKDPRYPHGHPLFSEALIAKQVPYVFKEVFFPTQAKVRLSYFLVDDFYTQTVPVELFPVLSGRRDRRVLNTKTPKKTTILMPQTQHPIQRRNHPKENPDSKNFKSVLSYYAYNEERKDGSKYSSTKKKKYSPDKSSDNKNFKSMLSYYAYNEDGNDGNKYSLFKKEKPNPKKRTKPSKFRRLLERIRSTQSTPPELQIDNGYTDYYVSIAPDPQNGPPVFLSDNHNWIRESMPSTTESPFIARRLGDQNIPVSSHENTILDPNSPFELDMPRAAVSAIAPAVSFFKNLLSG